MDPLNGAAGADCIHASVFNILRFKGFTNYEEVWKQCGIIYTKQNRNELGVLRGKYMNFVDELHWIHRIRLVPFYTKNSDEFINGIINQLEQSQPVLIHVDVYNLVDNQFYKKKSTIHMITIVDYKNGIFTYLDETYIKKSTISRNNLLDASWVNRNFEDQYNYFIVDLSEARIPEVSDRYRVLDKNLQYLSGNVSKVQLRVLESELYPHQPNIIVGINAIKMFLDDYKEVFSDFHISGGKYFDPIYLSFLNLSISHYRFAAFLAGNGEYSKLFHSTIEGLKDVSQEWKVASNMLIKALYKQDNSMVDRMIIKVEKLMKDQHHLIQETTYTKEKNYE